MEEISVFTVCVVGRAAQPHRQEGRGGGAEGAQREDGVVRAQPEPRVQRQALQQPRRARLADHTAQTGRPSCV